MINDYPLHGTIVISKLKLLIYSGIMLIQFTIELIHTYVIYVDMQSV